MNVSFNNAPVLLTDEQMRQYIVDGYVMLEPSFPMNCMKPSAENLQTS